jgi:hypothetical protein
MRSDTAPSLPVVVSALRAPPRPYAEWRGLLLAIVVVVGLSSGLPGLLALALVLGSGDLVRLGAMRLVGLEDRRLVGLPVPLAELRPDASPWKEAALILAQPLYLVALALGSFALTRATASSLALELCRVTVWVGAFTLLPLEPLDGWRLLDLGAYSWWRPLEVVVSAVVAALLLVAGVAQGGLFWVGLGAFVALTAWNALKLVRASEHLRATAVPLGASTAELPEASLRAVREQVDAQLGASLARFRKRTPEAAARLEASHVREVHRRAARRTPPPLLSALVVAAWLALGAGFGLAAVRFAALTEGLVATPAR